MPNRSLALDDEGRQLHGVELGQAALRRLVAALRRLEGEGEADDRGGAGLLDGAAGDPRAQRAAACDQGQALEFARAKVLDHRDPGLVEGPGDGWGAPPGDAIGLLDEGDAHTLIEGGIPCGEEVRRLDAAGAVTDHEAAEGSVRMKMRARSLAGSRSPRSGSSAQAYVLRDSKAPD